MYLLYMHNINGYYHAIYITGIDRIFKIGNNKSTYISMKHIKYLLSVTGVEVVRLIIAKALVKTVWKER